MRAIFFTLLLVLFFDATTYGATLKITVVCEDGSPLSKKAEVRVTKDSKTIDEFLTLRNHTLMLPPNIYIIEINDNTSKRIMVYEHNAPRKFYIPCK